MFKKRLSVLCLCCLVCVGCGTEADSVSTEMSSMNSVADDTLVITSTETEVELETTVSEEKNEKPEQDFSAIFDEDFNSYYTINDGAANATTTMNTETMTTELSKDDEDNEPTEIIFEDEQVMTTVIQEEETQVVENEDSYEVKTGDYTSVSSITRVISEDNHNLTFTNDSTSKVRYALYYGEDTIFDSNFLNPGESISWDAFSVLDAGFYEFDYLYEVKDDNTTTTVYTATACIQVEK